MAFYNKTIFFRICAPTLLVASSLTHTMLVTDLFSLNRPDTAALIINDVSQKTGNAITPPSNFATALVHTCATVLTIPPTAMATAIAGGPLAGILMSAIGGTLMFTLYRQTTTDGKLMPVYQLINAHREIIEHTHADMQKVFNTLKAQHGDLNQSVVSQLIERYAHSLQAPTHNPFESIINYHQSINESRHIIDTIKQVAEQHHYAPLAEHVQEAYERIQLLIAEASSMFEATNNVYRPILKDAKGAAAA